MSESEDRGNETPQEQQQPPEAPPSEETSRDEPEKLSLWRRFRRWVGIRRYPGFRMGIRLRPRFFVFAAILLAFFLGYKILAYSESPSFCNSCHIMEPYYNAWLTSDHNFVPCVDCHYPPGTKREILWHKFQNLSQVAKYVTRTYSSKPFAQIEDGACLQSGCHSTRLLEGRVMNEGGIKFDHTPHLQEERRGRKLRCVSCHSQIVVGRHVEVTYDTCYLCHFKAYVEGKEPEPLGGCTGCHELPDRTIRLGNITYNHRNFLARGGISCENCHFQTVSGDGSAPVDRCFTCHSNPEHLARYEDTPLLHEQHVTNRKVACFHCHQPMLHGVGGDQSRVLASLNEPELPRPQEPPSDHPPSMNFDCSFCHTSQHSEQLLMYAGLGEHYGLPELPSPMYLARVGCAGCHYESPAATAVTTGKKVRASSKACVKCHGPEFDGMWEDTEKILQSTLAKMDEKQTAAERAMEGADLSAGEAARVRDEISHAAELLRFVRKARGEHNLYLASVALRRQDEALNRAGREMGADLPDLSGEDLLSGGYCASMCHASVGAEVPPEIVMYEEMGGEIPHAEHAAMMPCVRCHDLGAHKAAPLKPDLMESVCSECH